MKSKKVVANSNLEVKPYHTWDEGLEYELIEKERYIKLASNEGQINYTNPIKNRALAHFTIID